MESQSFWAALALLLVIEGLLPLFWPAGWRVAFQKLLGLNDGQLRFFGVCSVLFGLVLLWLNS